MLAHNANPQATPAWLPLKAHAGVDGFCLDLSAFSQDSSRLRLPAHWPAAYKKIVEHRIALIEAGPKQNKDIALIEQPEYKRRWNTTPYAEQTATALRSPTLPTKLPSLRVVRQSVTRRAGRPASRPQNPAPAMESWSGAHRRPQD
jgi:hypothetical protein